MKFPSGNPGMPVEVCNAKMVWLYIHAERKCATGTSDEESEKEEEECNNKEEIDNSFCDDSN
eukprot:10038144-Ditylum_brightwellii.AAC.1